MLPGRGEPDGVSGGKPTPGVNNAEFRVLLARLDLKVSSAYPLLGGDKRAVMRWYRDRDPVTEEAMRVLRDLVRAKVSADEIEAAMPRKETQRDG